MTPINRVQPVERAKITSDEALRIARLDGEKAYRDDLSDCRVTVVMEADGWHVDYELKDPNWNGGGPHYIIDASDGHIVWKIYEQ
jgi:hypothetical protein